MNPQDILNNIDIIKVNSSTEKKKRGRPLKNVIDNKTIQLQNNRNNNENDEIVICLKISDQDIKNYQDNGLSVKELNEEIESINNEISESLDDNIKTLKYYKIMIKKLSEENKKITEKCKELEEYISKITPMYYTETEYYPNYIDINDTNGKKIIPKKTKTCCLNCGYNISNLPVFLIDYYYDNNNDDYYYYNHHHINIINNFINIIVFYFSIIF